MALAPPPTWSTDELREAKEAAEREFVDRRMGEGVEQFAALERRQHELLRGLFKRTRDLLDLDGDTIRHDPGIWGVLRYLCSPPVSEEDLWTLVGQKFKRVPDDRADDVARVIRQLLDPKRFRWVERGVRPHPAAREVALSATASLLALERLRTIRRSRARAQEAAVAATLLAAGLRRTETHKEIQFVDDLDRGTFDREQKIAGLKCDVPVRLQDGRLLAIECKISNGPKNSWKRLKTEVGNKAGTWRNAFGGQVVTAAVIAGVYDLSCLEAAQNHAGVTIFWEHGLGELRELVEAAQP